jgi:hypothetical protein
MATENVLSKVVVIPTTPSLVEDYAVRSVVAVQTGDCALVRGIMLGLDDDIVAHARASRDVRIASLKAYYLSK